MNIQEANRLAVALMEQHGLFNMGYRFCWNRAKRMYGYCNWVNRTIALSMPLTAIRTPEMVRNTILHEIAHALCPNRGHDDVWRSKAMQLGCNGERCSNDVQLPHKWVGQCPVCHETFRRHRVTKGSYHGQCGPSHMTRIDWRLNDER